MRLFLLCDGCVEGFLRAVERFNRFDMFERCFRRVLQGFMQGCCVVRVEYGDLHAPRCIDCKNSPSTLSSPHLILSGFKG